MDHHRTSNNEWADRHRQALTTRHSHENVLNDREFELLLEAYGDLPDPRRFQARVICLLGGRLGLRAGEIAHLQTAWVDWNRKLIQILQHEPCECGYCQLPLQLMNQPFSRPTNLSRPSNTLSGFLPYPVHEVEAECNADEP